VVETFAKPRPIQPKVTTSTFSQTPDEDSCCSGAQGCCGGAAQATSCCGEGQGGCGTKGAPAIVATALAYFNDLEYGKGPEVVSQYTTEGATFACEALPQKTIAEYADFMKLLAVAVPDGKYEVLSLTWNTDTVTIVAEMTGTHVKQVEGLTPPPFDPPRKTKCHYTYTMSFSCCGKIKHMFKVFDIFTGFTRFGWPLPPAN